MKSLYYEIHVTIDPNFDVIETLKELGQSHGFRMAKLLMRKNEGLTRAEDDMFFTSRTKTLEEAITKTHNFCKQLNEDGFIVRRYKIEDTVVDSKIKDLLHSVGR